ncbi:uncharacterized protein CCR75_009613 [Bremia lactucae]|uniref:Mediator complex subunit 15 KIX domain-containing protein n=1 Tax=Bremia lactucae TaxID=4779 RepID=A0A976IDX9_BRELC|nr:hypothetical protein CCR75_009613 [Bremia lactucae]
MIGKIVSLLQQRKPDAPAEWIWRLPDMARRLEDSLYRTAKNRDEYGDCSSLKTRLQHLAVTMGARAQHKTVGNPRAAGAASVPGNSTELVGNATLMASNTPSGMTMNASTGAMGAQGHVSSAHGSGSQLECNAM